jgi:hypothetical protein
VLFRLPVIGRLLRQAGLIPARAAPIRAALAGGGSVGVVLDGVAGIFAPGAGAARRRETARVAGRRAIVAIALGAGARLVPVYAFGHTGLWAVGADPLGLLAGLSAALDVAVVPFAGRWGWPFGPARRRPLLLAFGEAVDPAEAAAAAGAPAAGGEGRPSAAAVEAAHARLVAGFREAFEAHRAAFGWPDCALRID